MTPPHTFFLAAAMLSKLVKMSPVCEILPNQLFQPIWSTLRDVHLSVCGIAENPLPEVEKSSSQMVILCFKSVMTKLFKFNFVGGQRILTSTVSSFGKKKFGFFTVWLNKSAL